MSPTGADVQEKAPLRRGPLLRGEPTKRDSSTSVPLASLSSISAACSRALPDPARPPRAEDPARSSCCGAASTVVSLIRRRPFAVFWPKPGRNSSWLPGSYSATCGRRASGGSSTLDATSDATNAQPSACASPSRRQTPPRASGSGGWSASAAVSLKSSSSAACCGVPISSTDRGSSAPPVAAATATTISTVRTHRYRSSTGGRCGRGDGLRTEAELDFGEVVQPAKLAAREAFGVESLEAVAPALQHRRQDKRRARRGRRALRRRGPDHRRGIGVAGIRSL